jgi:hypothetical protein
MFVTDKEKIIEAILPHVPPTEIATQDYAMKTWWKNIRRSGGLGLTQFGDHIFRSSGIEHWDFDWGEASMLGNIGASIALDRRMPCPYYFYSDKKRRVVRLYDSRVATLVALHGDFTAYINTLKERKHD